MEGSYVTGPAKNLLQIGRYGRTASDATPLDLSVAVWGRGEWKPDVLIDAVRKAGLPVELLVEKKRFDLGIAGQLRELAERLRPDIVQTHMVKSHFFLRYSGLWKSRPWVAFHHGYTKVDLTTLVYNQFDRWSLHAAHRVVTVCGPFAERLVRRGIPRERIAVQHNSVPPFAAPDPDAAASVRERLGLDGGCPVVLAVGRLSREKGYVELIHAAALVRARVPAFRIVIVGDGPERPRIEAAVAQHGLERHVTLAGHDNRIAPYFALADALAMPSHSEGSPNALLEAMAAGLPVVASAVGGIPEIVSDRQTALLVPPHDVTALAAALAEVLTDRGLASALGAAAREAAETRYSIAAHYRSLVSVYEGLLRP